MSDPSLPANSRGRASRSRPPRPTPRGQRALGIALVLLAASPLAGLRAFADPGREPPRALDRTARSFGTDHALPWSSGSRGRPCPRPASNDAAAMRALVVCAARFWGVPGGARRALRVARCESRLEPAALNPTGCGGAGCGGLFQQHLGYWAARAREFGVAGRSAFDPWANAVVSMRMAVQRGTWALDWPVCGRGG